MCLGWFDNGQDSTCQITQKGETFYGHDVSRKAIVTLVKHIIDQAETYLNTSLACIVKKSTIFQ
nr:hypothetical protein [Streptococcus gallolyticus]